MIRKLLVSTVLVSIVLISGVHYDAAIGRHSPYPSDEQLATEYGEHIGEQTLVFGDVNSIDRANETMSITVDSDEGPVTLRVTGETPPVRPGGVIQVFGTLHENHEIKASNTVVVERETTSRASKILLSVAGALLALIAFFGHWRINWETVSFVRR